MNPVLISAFVEKPPIYSNQLERMLSKKLKILVLHIFRFFIKVCITIIYISVCLCVYVYFLFNNSSTALTNNKLISFLYNLRSRWTTFTPLIPASFQFLFVSTLFILKKEYMKNEAGIYQNEEIQKPKCYTIYKTMKGMYP